MIGMEIAIKNYNFKFFVLPRKPWSVWQKHIFFFLFQFKIKSNKRRIGSLSMGESRFFLSTTISCPELPKDTKSALGSSSRRLSRHNFSLKTSMDKNFHLERPQWTSWSGWPKPFLMPPISSSAETSLEQRPWNWKLLISLFFLICSFFNGELPAKGNLNIRYHHSPFGKNSRHTPKWKKFEAHS